jgi:hypothetical protein
LIGNAVGNVSADSWDGGVGMGMGGLRATMLPLWGLGRIGATGGYRA